MKTTQYNPTVKSTYSTPQVEKVQLDNEISMVMMSGIFEAQPKQDPLMSLKGFRLFK
ncbi:MAG: hypothetical protein RLZZ65_117 [Bacteroidota bacterium]|jgi:hypothetical protein